MTAWTDAEETAGRALFARYGEEQGDPVGGDWSDMEDSEKQAWIERAKHAKR